MESLLQKPRQAPTRRPQRRGYASSAEIRELTRLIAEVALTPGADSTKLDRLVALRERISDTSARKAFEADFAALQMDLPILTEHGEIRGRDGRLLHTYARWEDINEVIKPLLSARGFTLRFRTEQHDGKVVVTGLLSHEAGFFQETVMRLPVDLSGDKNAVQGVGSSTSYGKRYAAAALLNLTSRGEDDDGKAAVGLAPKASGEQVELLRDRLRTEGRSEGRLAAYLGVSSLADLPVSRLPRAFEAVSAKRINP